MFVNREMQRLSHSPMQKAHMQMRPCNFQSVYRELPFPTGRLRTPAPSAGGQACFQGTGLWRGWARMEASSWRVERWPRLRKSLPLTGLQSREVHHPWVNSSKVLNNLLKKTGPAAYLNKYGFQTRWRSRCEFRLLGVHGVQCWNVAAQGG